ncbi:Uncharacterised protein [Bordetella pertussis]|nr:Uncharacterised protein [Bordetella pertussis]CFW49106.1 Uncharacterised protein [Bordetella pertussis]
MLASLTCIWPASSGRTLSIRRKGGSSERSGC